MTNVNESSDNFSNKNAGNDEYIYTSFNPNNNQSNIKSKSCNQCNKCECLCCPKKLRPKCCNCCCCLYILLIYIVIILIMVFYIKFGMINQIKQPTFEVVYGQLFNYGKYGTKFPPLIYLKSNGQLKVEAYNNMPFKGKVSQWEFNALTWNIAGNAEEWGKLKCSGDIPDYSNTSKYINDNNIDYNKSVTLKGKSRTNLTCFFNAPAIAEDMFNIGIELTQCKDDYTFNIGLSGYGYAYSPGFHLLVNASIDCWFQLNGSNWMNNILPKWWHNYGPKNCTWFPNRNNTKNNEYYMSLYGNNSHTCNGFVPCYQWQSFPVLSQQCSIGVVSMSFKQFNDS